MGKLFFGGTGRGYVVDDETGITTEFGVGTFHNSACRGISYSIQESKAWLVFGDSIVRSYSAIDETIEQLHTFDQTGFAIISVDLQAYLVEPNIQYALLGSTTDTRLYKTTDGWETATLVYSIAGEVHALLSVDQSDPDHLLMRRNSNSQLYYSTSGGVTWNLCDIAEDGASSSLVGAYDLHPDAIYCGVLQVSPNQVSIQKSVNGGNSFSIVERFPDAAGISFLAVNPINSDNLLLLISDPTNELHYSVDGGVNFIDSGQTGMSQFGFFRDGTLYLVNTTGIFKSLTSGATWSQVATSPTGSTAKPTGQLKRWAGHFTGEEPTTEIIVHSTARVWKNKVLTTNGDLIGFTNTDDFVFEIDQKQTIKYSLVFGGITLGVCLIAVGLTGPIAGLGTVTAAMILSQRLLSLGLTIEALSLGGFVALRNEFWDPIPDTWNATLTDIVGQVLVQSGGVGLFTSAVEGQTIGPTDVIRTGRGATVLVTLFEGSQYTIEEDRTFTFTGRLDTMPDLPDGSRFAFWKSLGTSWEEIATFGDLHTRYESLLPSIGSSPRGSTVQIDWDRDFHENKFILSAIDSIVDVEFNDVEYELQPGEFFISGNSVDPSIVSDMTLEFSIGRLIGARLKINDVQYTQDQTIVIYHGDTFVLERVSGNQFSATFTVKVGGVETGTIVFSFSGISPFTISNLISIGNTVSALFSEGKVNLGFVWNSVQLAEGQPDPPEGIIGLNFQHTWQKQADLIVLKGIHQITDPDVEVSVIGFKHSMKQDTNGLLVSSIGGRFVIQSTHQITTNESLVISSEVSGPAVAPSGSTPYQYHQVSARYRVDSPIQSSDLEPDITE